MRVWVPDLFVSELLTIDAQASRAVAVSCVTTLHHEVSDDAMEAVALVVHCWALFTRAQGSEVLTSLGHISEKLKDNSTGLEAFFTFVANRDIKECLWVLWFELWQSIVRLHDLRRLFLVVDALGKERCEAFLLFLGHGCLLSFDRFKLVAKIAIGGSDLNCGLNVCHGFVEFADFHLRDTTQVHRLGGVGFDLECLSAVDNSVTIVFSAVGADGHVLEDGDLEAVELRRVVFDSLCVG